MNQINRSDNWQILDSTKLQTYLTCPRQFFFSHILGWKSEAPSNHLVFGQAWHSYMAYMLEFGYSAQSLLDGYEQAFLPTYRQVFAADMDETYYPKTPQNAFLAMKQYVTDERFRRDLESFKVISIEQGGRVAISPERSLVYKIDAICQENSTGKIFCLEHKTTGGSFSRTWLQDWSMSFQIGTYNHALLMSLPIEQIKETLGVIVNGVAFSKNKSFKCEFERVPINRSINMLAVWLYLANSTCSQIEQDITILCENCSDKDAVMTCFDQRPTSCSKYFGCEWMDLCTNWANPLAHCQEPPFGWKVDFWNPLQEERIKEVKDLSWNEMKSIPGIEL